MGARPLSQTTRDRASAQRPAGPGRLILAVNSSAVGLNVVAGDQYVADVLPSRMFSSEFERRGRAVEDSGTVTSVLVPWNTCGAYMSGVLGVPTASYFPYCFFNFLSPILDVLYSVIGFKVPSITPETQIPESERGQETIATSDP
jgi:NhaC family Na+:H+ antiporter